MKTFVEPAKELPVYGTYDTVVAGGGFAGIAAALAAARGGNRVLLCERMFILGGLGTAGLVTIYLPLCDGSGNQMSFSIAEELLKVSISYGHEAMYPKAWLEGGTKEERSQQRYRVRYNAGACAIAYEKLLLEAGVELLYGTTVCSAAVEQGKITHLIIENKSGRSAVACGNVIDCTGDADICKYAGEATAQYGKGNILAAWYYHSNEEGNHLKMLGFADLPTARGNASAEDQAAIPSDRRYVGLDAEELSQMVMESHEAVYRSFLKDKPLSQHRMLTSIASIPQIRMTRRIEGQYVMKTADIHKRFEDSVGMFGNWRTGIRGEQYELPYRALIGKNIKNLAVAGRCISADDDMWDTTRVIPVCAVSGEAVGTAAAMEQCFDAVDVKQLQAALEAKGVKLHA